VVPCVARLRSGQTNHSLQPRNVFLFFTLSNAWPVPNLFSHKYQQRMPGSPFIKNIDFPFSPHRRLPPFVDLSIISTQGLKTLVCSVRLQAFMTPPLRYGVVSARLLFPSVMRVRFFLAIRADLQERLCRTFLFRGIFLFMPRICNPFPRRPSFSPLPDSRGTTGLGVAL